MSSLKSVVCIIATSAARRDCERRDVGVPIALTTADLDIGVLVRPGVANVP